jgi:hypothetical protein
VGLVENETVKMTPSSGSVFVDLGLDRNCFYCGAILNRQSAGAGDHFPIPVRHGGTSVVPCCETCHDMKDRFLIDDWPLDWFMPFIEDYPKLSRQSRLLLAKILTMAQDVAASRQSK